MKSSMEVIALILVFVAVLIFGVRVMSIETSRTRSIPCPEEDACTVDYHDGAWHIGEPYGKG